MWTVATPVDDISHYGVKGMKWGVRKEYEPKGRKTSAGQYVVGDTKRIEEAKKNPNKKVDIEVDLPNIHEFVPRVIKTDTGTTKITEFDDIQKMFGTGLLAVGVGKTGDYAPKSVAKEKFDNLPKITEQYSDEVEQFLINRNAPTPERLVNCYECSIAYEMRKRGYDVQANTREGGTPLEIIHSFNVEDFFNMNSSSTDEAYRQLENECLTYGEGARGMLGMEWPSGGGHAINWEIKNGELVLIDNQKMGRNAREEFSKCDPSNINVIRLDNAEVLPGVTDFIENSEGYNGELDPEEENEEETVEDLVAKSDLRKDVEKYLDRQKNKEEHDKRVADALKDRPTREKGKRTVKGALKNIGKKIVKTTSKLIAKGKKIVKDILNKAKAFIDDPLDKSGKRKKEKEAKKKAKAEAKRKRKEAWDNDPRSTFDKIFDIREVRTTTNRSSGNYR